MPATWQSTWSEGRVHAGEKGSELWTPLNSKQVLFTPSRNDRWGFYSIGQLTPTCHYSLFLPPATGHHRAADTTGHHRAADATGLGLLIGFASLGSKYRHLRGACVCKHLETRWIGFVSLRRGTELFDATLSNEAMHQRGKGGLINHLYLLHVHGDETMLRLPSFWLGKLLFLNHFDSLSTNFRHMFDQFLTSFRRMSDQVSTSFRRIYPIDFRRIFGIFRRLSDPNLTSWELRFDELWQTWAISLRWWPLLGLCYVMFLIEAYFITMLFFALHQTIM